VIWYFSAWGVFLTIFSGQIEIPGSESLVIGVGRQKEAESRATPASGRERDRLQEEAGLPAGGEKLLLLLLAQPEETQK